MSGQSGPLIIRGDSSAIPLADNSVDAVITDPPYGLAPVNPRTAGGGAGGTGFMGKEWDKAVPGVEIWAEVLRVLKPGAFAAILCTPRQDCQARMIMNLEQAGFVTGFTSIAWSFATGFPKAANLSKMADKRAIVDCPDCQGTGVETVVTDTMPCDENLEGEVTEYLYQPVIKSTCERCKGKGKVKGAEREVVGKGMSGKNAGMQDLGPSGIAGGEYDITLPATPEAKALDGAYAGWQPKPAFEPVLIVMKPIERATYLDQAIDNGKGCSWLDDGRIPTGEKLNYGKTPRSNVGFRLSPGNEQRPIYDGSGRFPANLLCSDDCLNDGRDSKGCANKNLYSTDATNKVYGSFSSRGTVETMQYNDSGSYSRYFSLDAWFSERIAQLPEEVQRVYPWLIVPKPSKREKNAGLEGRSSTTVGDGRAKAIDNAFQRGKTERVNSHPTVKPVKLMAYLITLFSRPGDLVLDPFTGSGTTAVAAAITGREFAGIELEGEYAEIARLRAERFRDVEPMPGVFEPPDSGGHLGPDSSHRQTGLFDQTGAENGMVSGV